jgi:hypothetical protein
LKVIKGREKGAVAYIVEEHVAVLQLMLSDCNAFNASESSVEWQNMHRAMCKNYYLQSKSVPRSSATLHGHVVEMYSALKKGIRNLSLLPGAPKCPKSTELSEYADSLYSLLISDKKYMPKSWWSVAVVSMLLVLHLEHTSQFAASEQSLEWLDGKSVACRMKFEKDQKNPDVELKLKWQKEEDEHEEAAKHRKLVAESSIK